MKAFCGTHNVDFLKKQANKQSGYLISMHLTDSTQCELIYETVHEISNNVLCATSKASDQPAHMHSLIRAFASRLSIL